MHSLPLPLSPLRFYFFSSRRPVSLIANCLAHMPRLRPVSPPLLSSPRLVLAFVQLLCSLFLCLLSPTLTSSRILSCHLLSSPSVSCPGRPPLSDSILPHQPAISKFVRCSSPNPKPAHIGETWHNPSQRSVETCRRSKRLHTQRRQRQRLQVLS